jgi:hypothetical protein
MSITVAALGVKNLNEDLIGFLEDTVLRCKTYIIRNATKKGLLFNA